MIVSTVPLPYAYAGNWGEAVSPGRLRWVYPITWAEITKGTSAVAMGAAAVAGLALFKEADVTGVREAAVGRIELDATVVSSIRDLRSQVAQVRREQSAIIRNNSGKPLDASASAILSRLDAIEGRQARLEQAILTTPEKALAMPLLRRDLDAAKETNAQAIAAVKANVDQVYDLTKWFIGALAVGVFSLAIPNLINRRRGSVDNAG